MADPSSLSDLAKLGAQTTGASSPISIPISGAPVQSAANPIATTSFGNFQVGGAGNQAAANLPTPNSVFGGGLSSILQGPNLFILAAAGLGIFILLHRR